ncbi:hypothetical protein TTHERM_00112830 (macronuclear) [Tetrahymena thermophila SB210]|uniref:Uncharacterized protein n=1 Tax=Tetrahymena thermophila (strain SB210) TaxID=312017 RepID=Q22Z88_TETTS|nr:hypothetical protein TTHERM_00112830 [Tetrahymena thermophila SB210]EAR90433.3 hypothetical protein TTHERM_00112830 [Tetrahymena thermophila SB210]|eukprot:XP_001010678.3 hypothetical protein TTHERM_00112830 [Tetrahymena thermophila SB210]
MKKSSNQNKIHKTQLMDLESSRENYVQKRRKRAPKVYKNQEDLNLDFLDTVLVNKQLWKDNWLDGYQYYMLLKNQHRLDQKQFPLLSSHPTWIYEKPINGHLYFLKEVDLEKDGPFKLGFPRTSSLNKKSWKWKRNNFPTKLPKNDPKIVYICATTEGVESDENGNLVQKRFRMHIAKKIDLYNKELHNEENSQGLVVCQMLEIEFGKTKEGKKYIPKPISLIRKKEILYNQKKKQQTDDEDKIEFEVDDYSLEKNSFQSQKNELQNQKSYKKQNIFDSNRSFECDKIEIESNVSLNSSEQQQEQPQSIKIENQVDHISSTAEQCTAAISIENDKIFEKASPFKDQLQINSSQVLGSQNQSQDAQNYYQNFFHSYTKQNSNDPFIYLKSSIYSSQNKNLNLMQHSSIQLLKNAYQSKSVKTVSQEESNNSNQRSSQQNIKFSKKTSPIRKRLFQNYENNSLYQYQDIFSYSNTQNGNNSPQISDLTQNNFNIFNAQKYNISQTANRDNIQNIYHNSNLNNHSFNCIYDSFKGNQNNTNLEFQDFIEPQKFPELSNSTDKKIDQNQRKCVKQFCIFDQFQDFEDLEYFPHSKNSQLDTKFKNLELENDGLQNKKNALKPKISQGEKDIQSTEITILIQPVQFKQCKKNKDEYYVILI